MLKLVAFFSSNETTVFKTPLGTDSRISGDTRDLSKQDFLLIICKKTGKFEEIRLMGLTESS